MGTRGRDALLAARGATERTLAVLRNYLEERAQGRRLAPGS